MFVPTLNIKIQVLPAFIPPNKKKKFTKESFILNADSNLFDLHLKRVQIPKSVLSSLSDIIVVDPEPKVNENVECKGKTLKCLGTFSVGAIPLSWKQSLIFAIISDPTTEDKQKLSAKFSQFLNFLVEINQNLIVELNGELAVLQPTSCSLATLTCLKEAFYEPTKKLFKSENVYHLSKKMVATLLEEVMSKKNKTNKCHQDDSSDVASTLSNKTADCADQSNQSIVPVKTLELNSTATLGRTQSSKILERTLNQSSVHNKILIGTRKSKRPLEDPEIVRSPKRVKMSQGSCSLKRDQTAMDRKHMVSKLTRTKSAASWRSQLILEKSMELRQKSLMAGNDDDLISCLSVSHGDSFGKSTTAGTPSQQTCDQIVEGVEELKCKEELSEFIIKMYEKVIEEDGGIMSGAKNIIRATTQYFSNEISSQENPSKKGLILEETYNFASEHVLSTNAKIRDKYKGEKSSEVEEKKLKELQMQALLHCEVDSVCSSLKVCCETIDQRHKEVVAMLRTMSFIRDTNFLSTFLSTSLLENYHSSSPRFLYKIYDSLLYPLPTQLEYLMSPDKMEDDFHIASPIIQENLEPAANSKLETKELELDQLLQMERQMRPTRLSNKTQRSISFTQAPRMKIEIPVKKSDVPQQQRRSERIASATKTQKMPEVKDGRSKVRRSLFNDKKTLDHSPSKTPNKAIPTHYVLKTKQVRETPVGKQGINRYLKKQEKLMQSFNASDVLSVEDTPEKANLSLTQASSALDISTSFYANKHTIARFAHLEKRLVETRPQFMEQISPQLSLTQVVHTVKSPKRRVTAKMLFGSPFSPSPQKSALKTVPEESPSGRVRMELRSPKSPSENHRRLNVTFKTPENNRPRQDVPSNLMRARRAILMTPSPSRKCSEYASKVASPKTPSRKSPSPGKFKNVL